MAAARRPLAVDHEGHALKRHEWGRVLHDRFAVAGTATAGPGLHRPPCRWPPGRTDRLLGRRRRAGHGPRGVPVERAARAGTGRARRIAVRARRPGCGSDRLPAPACRTSARPGARATRSRAAVSRPSRSAFMAPLWILRYSTPPLGYRAGRRSRRARQTVRSSRTSWPPFIPIRSDRCSHRPVVQCHRVGQGSDQIHLGATLVGVGTVQIEYDPFRIQQGGERVELAATGGGQR